MKKIFISACFITLFSAISAQVVWLDADTGNEMDDLYAIARLVKEPGIKIAGISSAHFNNPDLLVFEKWNAYETRGLNTVAESQTLPLQFDREDTYSRLNENIEIERILKKRWMEQNPQDKIRIMWDLALVEAFLHPDKASLREVLTPPENTQRMIKVFTQIDTDLLSDDFWKALKR